MTEARPIQATVLRTPSPNAICTCCHSLDCVCNCHDRHCDPSEDLCHLDFLPDDGGRAFWGCSRCTPGEDAPHYLGCELIGWNVSVRLPRPAPGWSGGSVSAFA